MIEIGLNVILFYGLLIPKFVSYLNCQTYVGKGLATIYCLFWLQNLRVFFHFSFDDLKLFCPCLKNWRFSYIVYIWLWSYYQAHLQPKVINYLHVNNLIGYYILLELFFIFIWNKKLYGQCAISTPST